MFKDDGQEQRPLERKLLALLAVLTIVLLVLVARHMHYLVAKQNAQILAVRVAEDACDLSVELDRTSEAFIRIGELRGMCASLARSSPPMAENLPGCSGRGLAIQQAFTCLHERENADKSTLWIRRYAPKIISECAYREDCKAQYPDPHRPHR